MQAAPETTDDLARECLYRFLAAVAGGPYSPGWSEALDTQAQEMALAAAEWLSADECAGPQPFQAEIARLVSRLHARPDDVRSEYDRVFGLVVPKQCPPYETEYYPTQETFGRSQQMADVAGFYHAFGVEPAASSPERPDYLALELEFMALLLLMKRQADAAADSDPNAGEHAQVCEEAQRLFFSDHLAWWLPSFAAGLRMKAHDGYHEALAGVLAAWVPDECRRLGIEAVLKLARPELIEQPEQQSGCAACPLIT